MSRTQRKDREITCRSLPGNLPVTNEKEKDHDDTEPNPAHEMPESSPGRSSPQRPADACLCPGCRAGGDRALFLAGGPPTGAVPSLAPLVLATVAQLRVAG